MFKSEKAKSRSPFSEKMLRPAGESLRLKIEEIRDQFMETGLVVTFSLLAPSIVMMLLSDPTRLGNLIAWVVAAMAGYGMAFFQWRKIRELRKKLRGYSLGFDGERYVAAELNTLVAQGYRVFHDFVVDWKPGGEATNFNIDHIVVGATGVFAIETKARRKPNGEARKENRSHVVAFTGRALRFPSGYEDKKPIQQASLNAADLSKWLTGTAPVAIPVMPVVVIPGWMVKREARGAVAVLSGKELARHLPSLGNNDGLSADALRSIADRIEAYCRDVDAA